MNVLIRLITDVNLWLLLRSNGSFGTRFLGVPVLLLTTVGRSLRRCSGSGRVSSRAATAPFRW
jgi:hypothetical protein